MTILFATFLFVKNTYLIIYKTGNTPVCTYLSFFLNHSSKSHLSVKMSNNSNCECVPHKDVRKTRPQNTYDAYINIKTSTHRNW